ncbi:putative ATP-grasp-modified RiPP [Streptomyces sp. AM6-12]|uniref:putative ATP-grasp-modified RiPP n=1 Tax=Streptomyces sp. AM6-12 TaxID=3345149 RepID=UPI0037B1D7B6
MGESRSRGSADRGGLRSLPGVDHRQHNADRVRHQAAPSTAAIPVPAHEYDRGRQVSISYDGGLLTCMANTHSPTMIESATPTPATATGSASPQPSTRTWRR